MDGLYLNAFVRKTCCVGGGSAERKEHPMLQVDRYGTWSDGDSWHSLIIIILGPEFFYSRRRRSGAPYVASSYIWHLMVFMMFTYYYYYFPKFCIVEEVQSTLCCKPIDTTPDERSLWHTLIILGQVLCKGKSRAPYVPGP